MCIGILGIFQKKGCVCVGVIGCKPIKVWETAMYLNFGGGGPVEFQFGGEGQLVGILIWSGGGGGGG